MNFSKSSTIFAILCIIGMTNCFGFTSEAPETGRRMLSQMSLLDSTYIAWRQKYGKAYGAATEQKYRKEVFAKKFQSVLEHNAKADKSYTLGLNKFSDLTADEFKAQYLKFNPQNKFNFGEGLQRNEERLPSDLVQTKDWTKEGCVTPIKDQEQCGSCYVFAATGAIEGHHSCIKSKKKNKPIDLSEQFFLDCEGYDAGDMGCDGGLMDNVYSWMTRQDIYVPKASKYPYRGEDRGTCNKEAKGVIGVKEWGNIPSVADGTQLCAHVNKYGPIAVAVQASGTIQDYGSGIIDGNCGSNLDHGVTLVGCEMEPEAPAEGEVTHYNNCDIVPSGPERQWCIMGHHDMLMQFKNEHCVAEMTISGQITEMMSESRREQILLKCANAKMEETIPAGTYMPPKKEPKIKFFKVKNSWGSDFGEEGYFRVAPGNCGIHMMATAVKDTKRNTDVDSDSDDDKI